MQGRLTGRDMLAVNISSLFGAGEEVHILGRYKAQCFEYEGGPLLWEEEFNNVVTTQGKNYLLDSFITGFTQVGPYMGLISNVSWAPLSTSISSLTSYTGSTVTLATAAAHGLLPGDTFTIGTVTGTGTNITAVQGTWVATTGTTGSTLVFSIGAAGLTITTLTAGAVTTASATRIGDTLASHGLWTEAGTTNAPTWTTPASGARAAMTWNAASGGVKSTASAVSFTIGATGGTLQGAFIVLGTGAVVTNLNTSGFLFSGGAFSGGPQAVSSGNVVTVSYSLSI